VLWCFVTYLIYRASRARQVLFCFPAWPLEWPHQHLPAMSQPDVAEPISMPGAVLTCSSTSGAQKRGSNFGRVDALRWWLKLRHEGAPACPGACFQAQKSKRKPHERDMRDNLEVCRLPCCRCAAEARRSPSHLPGR